MRWLSPRRRVPESEARREEVLRLLSKRLKECDDLLRAHPDDADALFAKGVFLARIGEYERSLECLDRVTRDHPEYPGVWFLKSSLYERVGDAKRAALCRKRATA